VSQESPDELHHPQAHGSPSAALWLLIAERHPAVLHFDDTAVGDGHAEDIRGEVFNTRLRIPDRLTVDVPVLLPCFGRDMLQESGLPHPVAELGAKDGRKSQDRQIEGRIRRMPATIPGRKRSAGNDVVDMGMVLQLPSPGMQHAEETRQITANELRVLGQHLHRLRRSGEQG